MKKWIPITLCLTGMFLVGCSQSAGPDGGSAPAKDDAAALALPALAETHVISSVAQQVNHENKRIDGKGWHVQVETLKGGRSEGCQLITMDNGSLTIRVIPTRGMGILDVQKGDVRLGWDSPVPEIVHPSYIDLESRGGLGWLEGFNEWMVRCGLEFAGHPGTAGDVCIPARAGKRQSAGQFS